MAMVNLTFDTHITKYLYKYMKEKGKTEISLSLFLYFVYSIIFIGILNLYL